MLSSCAALRAFAAVALGSHLPAAAEASDPAAAVRDLVARFAAALR